MWKKYQKQNRQSKQIKLALAALGILILLLGVAKLFSMFSSLSQPFNSGLNSNKKYSWDGKSSVNILLYYPKVKSADSKFNDSKLALINLRPDDESIIVLHISDDIYMDLPKGYGSWKVGSIFDLGQEEKPQIGASLLKLSASKLVGLPIEGLIVLNSQDENFSPENEVTNWRKNPLASLSFAKNITTDLTPIELFKFIHAASAVRSDKITALNLAQSNITQSKLLPDSSRVLGVDAVKLDTFIRDRMADTKLVDEGITVAIFNATRHPGLAQDASRILNNMGINVIIVSNTENYINTSAVFASDNAATVQNSLTKQKVAQYFSPNCLKDKCSSSDAKVNGSRAQITVVLGEDYYNLWYQK